MATQTLPALTEADLASHKTSKSCWVTLGNKVYDVTDFLPDHPGGGDLIVDLAGKDIGAAMADEISHTHTEAAYEILDEYLVGFVAKGTDENGVSVYAATGMSCAADLEKETDLAEDLKKHKFLDLNKPMFLQLWRSGFSKEFYLEQVHRPRHYKNGDSAPLFGGILEPLTKTPWWIVPTIWVPCVAYGTALCAMNLPHPSQAAGYFVLGLAIWTFLEYALHRCVFHLDQHIPDNRVAICLHFILHGIHHFLPMDRLRLVMPPTLFLLLATPFWPLAHTLFAYNWYAATGVFCGGVFGYICYDLTHYFLHHKNLPGWYKELKKYHMEHHFADYESGFGVTSRFWDRVFGTELGMLPAPKAPKVLKSQ